MTASQKYLLEMGYNDLILTHPAKPRVYASKVLSDFAQLRTSELEADNSRLREALGRIVNANVILKGEFSEKVAKQALEGLGE